MAKSKETKLTGQYKEVYGIVHRNRVVLIDAKKGAEEIKTKDKKAETFLAELTDTLEVVIDELSNTSDVVEELGIERDQEAEEASDIRHDWEALTDPDHYGIGDEYSTKLSIVRDLMDNCTVEELEALEMLMRIKKGSRYSEKRAALIHPDNVNIGLCFGNLEQSVDDYLIQELL